MVVKSVVNNSFRVDLRREENVVECVLFSVCMIQILFPRQRSSVSTRIRYHLKSQRSVLDQCEGHVRTTKYYFAYYIKFMH